MKPRKLPPIVVPTEACRDYARSSAIEWLETNGTGGYAMGTVSLSNTRRYHGLLVASLRPPTSRFVTLAKLDEEAVAGDAVALLASNQYPGVVHPDGYARIEEFRLDPFPTWTVELSSLAREGGPAPRLSRSLFLVQGEQTVVMRYRATHPMALRLRPMLAFRDHHALARANDTLDGRVADIGGSAVRVRPYGELPALSMHSSGGVFHASGGWHYQTEYLAELERGLDFREDLYCVGAFELTLEPGRDAWIVATFEEGRTYTDAAVAALERQERARRCTEIEDPLVARLAAAADQFVVRRADGTPTAIAGYPWFTDWGRDTMIALPGLLLARGRAGEARAVIDGFLAHLDRGLVPNRFPDDGERPEYNTVDATLWMFVAAHRYLEATGDLEWLRGTFYPKAREILRWHLRGTHHGIRVDPTDGLLIAGDAGAQLTWMDAKVGDVVMTPRHGKPVEINALYYNALRLTAQWARRLGDDDSGTLLDGRAERVRQSFDATFWNDRRQCLYDVILPEGPDARLRPNQIFAIALPFPLLSPERRRAVVRTVERELLTHVGLRTLAPGDPGYQPHYRGDSLTRDSAYHQGVVWPWLLGGFIRAYVTAFGRTPSTTAYCRGLLRGLELHLADGCLGTVSEVFEAEAPFRPVAAPAQAWSVAELLSVLTSELADDARAPAARALDVDAR